MGCFVALNRRGFIFHATQTLVLEMISPKMKVIFSFYYLNLPFFVVPQIQEHSVDYTTCQDCDAFVANKTTVGKTCPCTKEFTLNANFKGQVYMYYGLTSFYQARLYVL